MVIDLNTILDIIKVVLGLVYLYYEYYARSAMWVVSIMMTMVGLWLYWNKGLYADCAINVYYLMIAVYGFIGWTRGSHVTSKKSTGEITHVGKKNALVLSCVFTVMWCIVAWILRCFTDSTVPLLDSFTTSLSIVGMWMLARKYVEQWLVWFLVDAVYVWLYYKKGIYFSGTLYVFYTVMALVGYRRWQRQMV